VECFDEVGDQEANKKHASGFTKTEDLLICKAFVAASEDSQVGAYQKPSVFKVTFWKAYVRLLEEQERMDCIRVNGCVKDKLLPVYDRRNGNTLHCRFKDNLSFRCSKLFGIEESTPLESGL
jgi:hypothetical protein